jgi:murein tripeptide amidase MpaA
LLWLLSLSGSSAATRVSYEGHQVWRLLPENAAQLRVLAGMSDVDFWLDPSVVGRPVDLRVSPSQQLGLISKLAGLNLSYSVHIPDVEEHFNESYISAGADWDDSYHRLADINTWLQQQVAANPKLASIFEVGQTYEKRTVYGIKITGATGADKPQIYYDGGIHAREWIAPAVVQYIIGQFLSLYGTDPTVTKLVDSIEWYFVPVFNADGYDYTWASDRNWRKNRQPNTGSSCVGTDLNRNADAGFGGEGASPNPCAETFYGKSAFSGPILKATSVFLAALPRLKGYINFHSYGQLFLTPYGYTIVKPRDYDVQQAWAKASVDAIKKVSGKTYTYGPTYTAIYPASGSIIDWLYDKGGVVYTSVIELRGNSFAPPASEIKPNGQEILAAVIVHANTILPQ